MKQATLLLKGGQVVDPVSQRIFAADVAISEGKILSVGPALQLQADKTLDVTGCYVTPGLIDMHCHCYPTFPFDHDTLPTLHPDAHMFQNGVTTAVDAGTCGWQNFPRFYTEVIRKAEVRTLAFLNIADRGMVHMADEDDPNCFHPRIAAEVARAYDDVIVGIKTAHYWVNKPFDALHTPWASVDAMIEAGERSASPVWPISNRHCRSVLMHSSCLSICVQGISTRTCMRSSSLCSTVRGA